MLLLFSIMFFFCSYLYLFLMPTFTPISFYIHFSTPLSIFPLIPPISVIITLFFLSLFSLCYIFSSIIFILFIQSAFFACHFSSFPLISSLTAANSFLSSTLSSLTAANSFFSTLFYSLIPAVSSLISLIMVFFHYPFPCFYSLLHFYLGIYYHVLGTSYKTGLNSFYHRNNSKRVIVKNTLISYQCKITSTIETDAPSGTKLLTVITREVFFYPGRKKPRA
jgi:hypothetical protein